MLNFKKYKEVDFPVSNLRNERDVKSEATKDQNAVDQLVAQGSLPELPLVTFDGVYNKGRTGAKAEIVWGTVNGIEPLTIRVNQLPWSYDTLNDKEKLEFWAESLRQDWAADNSFRIFATNEDAEMNIKRAIQDGASKPFVFENYAYIGKPLPKIYADQLQSVLQSDIRRISDEVANGGTWHEAGERLGLSAARIRRAQEAKQNNTGHHGRGLEPNTRTASTVFKKRDKKYFQTILTHIRKAAEEYRNDLLNDKDNAKFTREIGELFALWSAKIAARGKEASETLRNTALDKTPRTPKI